MNKWLEGRVVENRHWTDALFSLRVEGVALSFQAGQFVRIALEEDLARPFSFVNPPADPVLEFYGIVVPEGPLSPRLARLRAGERLLVASNPAGFLVLSEVPDADTLWLVSTGTGIAPFLSILRTETPWKRFGKVVLVHAVRHARELVYTDLIGKVHRENPGLFHYVTFVSREKWPGSLHGRIPAAMRDGHPVAQRLDGIRRTVGEVGKVVTVGKRQIETDNGRRRALAIHAMTGRTRGNEDLLARRVRG